MPAFATYSTLINSVTTYGDMEAFTKSNRVGAAAAAATVAGQLTSLWQYNGSPSDGAAPTTVAAPTRTTAGALAQPDATGGRAKYLIGIAASASAAGTLILYDRLLHIGNLSGTVTTPQTVGGSLTRNTGGSGNQIFAEIYTAIGSTATTVTASYTNTVPTSGRTTVAVTIGSTGFSNAQRMLYMPLQSGDSGVTAVASADLVASTLTAGAWGITVARPLVILPLGQVACGAVRDFVAGTSDFPLIEAGACLAWMWVANSTGAPQILGTVSMTET